jgi:hypothetical protein
LGTKRHIQDERPRWAAVLAGDDNDRPRPGCEFEVAHLTGWGFIEQVEDLLLGDARALDIRDVAIGELYNLSDALPGLCCLSDFLAQWSFQLLTTAATTVPASSLVELHQPSTIVTYSTARDESVGRRTP